MAQFRLWIERFDSCYVVISLSAGEETVTLDPTCIMEDGLGGMTKAAADLLERGREARVAWFDEPGEWRWLLSREAELVRLRMIRFREYGPSQPDDQGETEFEASCTPLRFATQVAGQMKRLLNEHGADGYQRNWRASFPTRDFDRLLRLIVEEKKRARQA
jgi:hypothetical protein